MKRYAAVMVLAVLASAACSGGSDTGAPTARTLARRLDDGGLCTKTLATPARQAALVRASGMTKTWVCYSPANRAHGGIEVGLWAGRTSADKRRLLEYLDGQLRDFCTSRTAVQPARPDAIEQYVEGDTWLALVGINARFRAVASTLHGKAVTKHCP